MENRAFVRLYTYSLSGNDLKSLPESQRALLGLVNYAASELNALQRVYISLAHNLEGESWLDVAIVIQRNTILRIWSAKLFELMDSVGQLAASSKIDNLVKSLAANAVSEMESLRDHHGYSLARNFRHESTNHYSFKAAQKNLPHLPENADCNMYLHEMDGNSFYPMGEELMFIGRLNRHGGNLLDEKETLEQINAWMSWNLEANKWARSFHSSVFEKTVVSRLPERCAHESWNWINPKLVGEMSPPTTPIFLRKKRP